MSKPKKIPLKWYSPKKPPFQVAGFYWFGAENIYRRLPLRPKAKLPKAVDGLANHTAGGQIRFRTNSRNLSIRVKMRGRGDKSAGPWYTNNDTPGDSFDCYVGAPGQQMYYGTARASRLPVSHEQAFFSVPESKTRNITLYFPLYRGVKEVSIGVDPGAKLLPPVPFKDTRPLVVYGTSIGQGGCASRPGMAYTNILGRWMIREFLNMGFAGSGKGEPEVARALAEIQDPACFTLFYDGNCPTPKLLKKTLPEFIRILRAAHPKVPILVISKIKRSEEDTFDKRKIPDRMLRKQIQRRVVEVFRKRGDKLVFFQDGENLLGKYSNEGTVDACHPSDLGFMKMAESLLPVFKKIL